MILWLQILYSIDFFFFFLYYMYNISAMVQMYEEGSLGSLSKFPSVETLCSADISTVIASYTGKKEHGEKILLC
jgi:hypothetical protein